jgi:hypothetical protein
MCVAAIVLLCVCSHSLPYFRFDCDNLSKAVRDSKLLRFLTNGFDIRKTYVALKVLSLDHLRGVDCNT